MGLYSTETSCSCARLALDQLLPFQYGTRRRSIKKCVLCMTFRQRDCHRCIQNGHEAARMLDISVGTNALSVFAAPIATHNFPHSPLSQCYYYYFVRFLVPLKFSWAKMYRIEQSCYLHINFRVCFSTVLSITSLEMVHITAMFQSKV